MDLDKYKNDPAYRESVRGEIRGTARKLLSGEIGTIEASPDLKIAEVPQRWHRKATDAAGDMLRLLP